MRFAWGSDVCSEKHIEVSILFMRFNVRETRDTIFRNCNVSVLFMRFLFFIKGEWYEFNEVCFRSLYEIQKSVGKSRNHRASKVSVLFMRFKLYVGQQAETIFNNCFRSLYEILLRRPFRRRLLPLQGFRSLYEILQVSFAVRG